MADEVVETSTNEDFISVVAARIHQHEREIIQCLCPSTLVSHLVACELIDFQEEGELFLKDKGERKESAKHLLAVLAAKGPEAYLQFLECLEKETSHLGHAYIASLLRGEEFGNEDEVRLSCKLKKRIYQCMPEFEKGISTHTLTRYLTRDGLLTDDEHQLLIDDHRTRNSQARDLLLLLGTKGPTAHYVFTRCLEEEEEHRTHWKLFQKITDEDDRTFFRLHSKHRKRKADDVTAVTKRVPDRLQAQGTLLSKEYFDCMKQIRRHHLTGKWSEADEIVERCMLKNDVVLQIAVTLENCTGYITRREEDTVLTHVERARELCELVPSDNWTFLRGRCEWVLAKLYRYVKDSDAALKHIRQAMELQFNVESGEDAALTNYCHACILLESLAVKYCVEDSRKAKVSLEFAIHYASNEDYGLDLSHPRIRLAQLYLGSSPSQPGRNQDPSSLSKAKSSLQVVEKVLDTLAPRTQCIFYFTKSDLLHNESETAEAKRLAQLALDIATENNFKTEVASARARLDSL